MRKEEVPDDWNLPKLISKLEDAIHINTDQETQKSNMKHTEENYFHAQILNISDIFKLYHKAQLMFVAAQASC